MNKICMKLICTLILFIVLAGCEKTVEREGSVLAVDPMAEKVALPPEFASIAIDKTGGLGAWGKIRQLQLKCIVTFYNTDAGHYLTEQKFDVFPWSDSIVVSGKEARESYKWQLSQGEFSVLNGTGEIKSFGNEIQSSCMAESVLNLVTAPIRFMDNSFVYSRDASEINLQGRWCYPITTVPVKGSNAESNAVYYQNKASSMVDMVLLNCKGVDSSYLVCGYDYGEFEDLGVSIPQRIEIHLADENGITTRQLFKIDVLQ